MNGYLMSSIILNQLFEVESMDSHNCVVPLIYGTQVSMLSSFGGP